MKKPQENAYSYDRVMKALHFQKYREEMYVQFRRT